MVAPCRSKNIRISKNHCWKWRQLFCRDFLQHNPLLHENGKHILQIGRLLLGQSLVAVFNVGTLLRTNSAATGSEPRALLGARTLARTQAFIDCDKMKLYLKAPEVERDWGF